MTVARWSEGGVWSLRGRNKNKNPECFACTGLWEGRPLNCLTISWFANCDRFCTINTEFSIIWIKLNSHTNKPDLITVALDKHAWIFYISLLHRIQLPIIHRLSHHQSLHEQFHKTLHASGQLLVCKVWTNLCSFSSFHLSGSWSFTLYLSPSFGSMSCTMFPH